MKRFAKSLAAALGVGCVFAAVAVAAGTPIVGARSATRIRPTTVVLRAVINPNGHQTNWVFEYGPTAAYGLHSRHTPATQASGPPFGLGAPFNPGNPYYDSRTQEGFATFGAPEVTGKPNASDLREGKRTLLVARALEAASARDAARLRAGLGRKDLSDADAAELRDILVRSGAAQACRDDAERLCAEAIGALDRSPIPPRTAETLRQIATYSVRRAL